MIKITAPQDMELDIPSLTDELIEALELGMARKLRGKKFYSISVAGSYPTEVTEKIVALYKEVGWSKQHQ